MKKLGLLVLSFFFVALFAGCNSSPTSKSSVAVKEDVTPEVAVKAFYGNLQKGDFPKAVDQLSKNVFVVAGMNKEQYVEKIKDEHLTRSIKINEFSVIHLKDIDANHKSFSVPYKATVNGKSGPGKEDVLAVKENGTWKVDTNMLLSLISIKNNWSWNLGGGKLVIADFLEGERPDGKFIQISLENKTNQPIQFGWSAPAYFKITTDKGTYTEEINGRYKILPGKKESLHAVFKNASGRVNKASLQGIYVLDSRGLPDGEGRTFVFEIK